MQTSSAAGRPAVNIGDKERLLSALAGTLILYAAAKKHPVNALLLLGGGYLLYRAVSGHCPIYSANAARRSETGRDITVRTHVVVSRPREEVYAFWRRLENLPLFMQHLENIDELDASTSAWKLKIPGGAGEIRWEAKIVQEEKDRELSWHSMSGAAIRNTGKINFSDTPGRGTRVDVMISYGIPPGAIGERLTHWLTPAFGRKVEQDIHRFRAYMEEEIAGS